MSSPSILSTEVAMNVARIMVGDPLEWLTLLVEPKKRICISFDDCVISFYECMFTRIRLWLPFNDFEVVVLKYLKFALSQHYPGSWHA